ncbi:hypothetical protein T439DRAFT_375935 [Meredithblackwellia eburnea MCA 4105]
MTVPTPSASALKARAISRDFRTDTITHPTPGMIQAQAEASLGDAVYGEDVDTAALERRVAQLAGKEAGLFCVSGTMTNQLAIRTHLKQPPHSVLLDARSHVHLYEAGGVAFHSQANSLAITPSNGHHLTLEDIEANIVRGEDIHGAPTRIVSLENTLSGTIMPQEEIVRISNKMRAEGVIMHLDGARLWEVAAKTGLSIEELCRPFDTISLCMSKGLGAPIGSVLVGPHDIIKKATWFRKLFGGGVRQSGSLAVGADYALTNHFPLLRNTHHLATALATGLVELNVKLLHPVETNMVWISTSHLGFSLQELNQRAKSRGITLGAPRIVVHFQVVEESVRDLLETVRQLKEEFKDKAVDLPEFDVEQSARFAKGDTTASQRRDSPVPMNIIYGNH